jgi:acetylornithine deacetylase
VPAINEEIRQKTLDFLQDLIRIPSTRGHEGAASRYVYRKFNEICDQCELVKIDDGIMQDPDYDFKLPDFTYRDTPQVEARIKGSGEGKTILFNTHLDVVPPSEGQENPFSPQIRDGRVYGRGAVDAKGQVAALFALAQAVQAHPEPPAGDLVFHLVVEEENGGNGTLAMVNRGVEADAAVVLEPSELRIFAAVRGAVWFQIKVLGKATHSGNTEGRISAIDKAYDVMAILRDYHDRLLEASRNIPLFDAYDDPMPLTFGQIKAGTWPATVPAEAELKGLIGFLPNKTKEEVEVELEQAIRSEGDDWLRENFEITFPMLRNDGNQLPVDHPLVQALAKALDRQGIRPHIDAMVAACDAWQYANKLNIPTVVFGPGSLGVAHAAEEHISIEELFSGAEVLVDFVYHFD